MQVRQLLKILGLLCDIRVVINSHIENANLKKDLQKKYLHDIEHINDKIHNLKEIFELCRAKHPIEENEVFLKVELDLSSKKFSRVVQEANQAIEYYCPQGGLEGGNIPPQLTQAIRRLSAIRAPIYEFLENEQTFINECSQVDSEYVQRVYQRYSQGGEIPLIDEIPAENMEGIERALKSAEYYKEIKNVFKLTIDNLLVLNTSPLAIIEMLYGKVKSREFAHLMNDNIAEIVINYGELSRIVGDLLAKVLDEKERLGEIVFSDEFLSNSQKWQLKKILRDLLAEEVNPYNNDKFYRLLENVQERVGDARYQEVKQSFVNIYYCHRDSRMLDGLNKRLSVPWQRAMRYPMTLKEIKAKLKKFNKDSDLLGHLQGAIDSIEEKNLAINQLDRELDDKFQANSKRLTERLKREGRKSLLIRVDEELDELITFQGQKTMWTNPLSYYRAEPKRIWLTHVKEGLRSYLAEGKLDNIAQEDEEDTFEADMRTIEEQALDEVNAEQRDYVFEGTENNTSAFRASFFEEIKSTASLRFSVSVFGDEQSALEKRQMGGSAKGKPLYLL